MKMLGLMLGLLIPAVLFGQTAPLPDKPVTIHATLSAYEACFAVAKILGVEMSYVADLKTGPIKLDLENVTGAEAFDKITAVTHKLWVARPSLSSPGQVLVIVSDPPPQPH
jgi:hypothetical protein